MSAVETRGPLDVEKGLETAAIDLDGLGKELDAATDEMEAAEEDWIAHYDTIIEELEDELEGNAKLPGEEKCVTAARRRGGWERWTRLRRAERNLKRIEKRITQTGNVISAYQSKLRQIRTENGGSY